MKKTITMLLLAAMLCTIAACGKGEGGEEDDSAVTAAETPMETESETTYIDIHWAHGISTVPPISSMRATRR